MCTTSYITINEPARSTNGTLYVNIDQFEVTFEILTELTEDIEWKLVYVGSAESDEHDQEIDSVLVAPQGVSRHSRGPYLHP